MIDIVVRECKDGWRVERRDEILLPACAQSIAIKFALGEASLSFERGEQAQVVFRPSDVTEEPLVRFG